MFRLILVFSIFLLYLNCGHCAMTEAQIKSAQKLIKNVCQPKTKVTEEQIDNARKGILPKEESLMCYFHCCLQMMKILKNDKVSIELAKKQIASLPEKYIGPFNQYLESCADAGKSEDKCEYALEIIVCFYKTNPEFFYLLP